MPAACARLRPRPCTHGSCRRPHIPARGSQQRCGMSISVALCHLPNGFAGPRGDRFPIEGELQFVCHGVIHQYLAGRPARFGARRARQEKNSIAVTKGIWSGLAEATNRCVAHGLGEFSQEFGIPLVLLEKRNRLVASNTARRALPARFVLEELQQIDRYVCEHGPVARRSRWRGYRRRIRICRGCQNREVHRRGAQAGYRRTRRPEDRP